MDKLAKLRRYQQQKAEIQRNLDKCTGAAEEILKSLKKEHACSGIDQARKRAQALRKRYEALSQKNVRKTESFEENFRDFLR